jgi:ubiquitin thioesterase OTU1
MTVPIRVRAPSGQLRLDVEENSTLGQLVAVIRERTGLQDFTLKYGYPLKNLDLTTETTGATIASLGLRGETIVVAPADSRPAAPAPKPFVPKGVDPDETVVEWPERGGYLGQ